MDLRLEEFLHQSPVSEARLSAVAEVLERVRLECAASVSGVVVFESGPLPPLVLYDCPDAVDDDRWVGELASQRDWWGEFRLRRVHRSDNLLRPERREIAVPSSGLNCTFAEAPERALTAFVLGAAGTSVGLQAALNSLAPVIPSALAYQRGRETTLRGLLGPSSQGVVVCGADGAVRYTNERARRLLGLGAELAASAPTLSSCGVALAPLVRTAQGSPTRVHAETEGPIGPLAVEARSLAESPSQAESSPVLVLLEDRSERRALLRHQQEFLGTVGHELRTPLTSMRAALEILTGEDVDAAETGPRLLELCQRNLDRLGHLVEQLLATAHSQMGRLVLERQLAALQDVLEPLVAEMSRRALASGTGVDASVDPECVAWIDRTRIVEMVEQLLDNAIKFSDVGGHVDLRVRPSWAARSVPEELTRALGIDPRGCWIEVEDRGPGMDDETRLRALDPFYQKGEAAGERPAGTGIGLTLVAELAAAHGGVLELDSTPGRGTCAAVWVPSSEALAGLAAALRELERTARFMIASASDPTRIWLRRAPSGQPQEGWVPLADGHWARLGGGSSGHSGDLSAPLGQDGEAIGTTLARLVETPSDSIPDVPGDVLEEILR